MARLRILAIESSCDETAVALLGMAKVKGQMPKVKVLKNFVTSQIPIHQKYGGVVPEVAARSHVPETVALISKALNLPEFRPINSPNPLLVRGGRGGVTGRGEIRWPFDAIAVTRGPGLVTALRVGVEAARVLAMVSGKPLIGVNHIEGHLASAWLDAANRRKWKFPLLALTVSGGHTDLVLMKDFCKYKIVGSTRDDAAGEAFDKAAKLMGLPYPGGPKIAGLALEGDPAFFDLPRPMIHDPSLDMSFSGLKTAVRQIWERLSPPYEGGARGGREFHKLKTDLAAGIQLAIVDVLVEKTVRAAAKVKAKGVLLVGGVSANRMLRETLCDRLKVEMPNVVFLPSDRKYITDNAAMIAAAGYWRLKKGERHDWKKLDADPELALT